MKTAFLLPRIVMVFLAASLVCTAAQTTPPASQASSSASASETLATDAVRTTVKGNRFTAPAGWKFSVRGEATILEPPEGNSHIALIDVSAANADAAVAAGWVAYGIAVKWPLKVTNDFPDKDGWSNRREYTYQTSPNEKRDVNVDVQRAGGIWTVVIYDVDQAVGEKRGAQVALIYNRLLPKGYQRESFAGRKAHKLDAKRIGELSAFVERGMWAIT